MVFAFALLVGVAMGAMLQRVGASSPTMIVQSLRLRDLTVIKFMATTIAVGAVAVALLGARLRLYLDIHETYVAGVTLGGLVFGVGFALGGFCPGTCVVGLGEGRKDALFALLGGLAGTVAYTALWDKLRPALIERWNYGELTLAGVLHARPLPVALGLAAALLAVAALVPTARAGGRAG